MEESVEFPKFSSPRRISLLSAAWPPRPLRQPDRYKNRKPSNRITIPMIECSADVQVRSQWWRSNPKCTILEEQAVRLSGDVPIGYRMRSRDVLLLTSWSVTVCSPSKRLHMPKPGLEPKSLRIWLHRNPPLRWPRKLSNSRYTNFLTTNLCHKDGTSQSIYPIQLSETCETVVFFFLFCCWCSFR